MTKAQLELAIQALQTKMEDLLTSGQKGTNDAYDKAVLDLRRFGEEYMNYKKLEFREDPNLDAKIYFNRKYVRKFKKIEAECLKVYNAALEAAGRQPINSLAA